jgi:hypothetical protein
MNTELNDLDLEGVAGGKDANASDVGPNKDGALFDKPKKTPTPSPTPKPTPTPKYPGRPHAQSK